VVTKQFSVLPVQFLKFMQPMRSDFGFTRWNVGIDSIVVNVNIN